MEWPHDEGSAAYFRIQGPTLVIEYAPQRSVDHIHTIYRDPTNDYGAALCAPVADSGLGLALAMTLAARPRRVGTPTEDYLQAARIDLEPDSVLITLDLTPGIAVAESFMAAIDHDRDGSLSTEEQRGYASEVVRALEIEIEVSHRPSRLIRPAFREYLRFVGARGPSGCRTARASWPVWWRTSTVLQERAPWRPERVLANALVPRSDRVSVSGQRRDDRQRELRIDFAVRGGSIDSTPVWLLVGVAAAVLMMGFSRRIRPS